MQCIKAPTSPLVVTHKQDDLKRGIVKKLSKRFSVSMDIEKHPSNCAVYTRDLCKNYDNGGPPVLQNMCMNVRKGTIYGLLGASGCGKTTVLSCIVGLTKWESGVVQVFGHAPGTKESGIPGRRLGYMPQETALYNELTIQENCQFYARIYNMTPDETQQRLVFLNKLLELPENSRRIADLSGGQRRRASMALALIHSPELLILDEPTVGLDPLLRARIWDYLYEMVNVIGTTIIVTTHYIEEARQAHTIGVIRKGRLLVEDKPLALLQKHQRDLLEQVVLQLCRKDENSVESLSAQLGNKVVFKSTWNINLSSCIADIEEDQQGIYRKTGDFDCEKFQHGYLPKEKTDLNCNGVYLNWFRTTGLYSCFQKIYGLTAVILLSMTRYPLFLALLVILPTFKAAITLLIIGTRPHGLRLGVVNNEMKNWTTVCEFGNSSACDLTLLSCKYLHELGKNGVVTLSSYDSENDALQNVHQGNIMGYLTFASNYTQHALDLGTAKFFATNESIEGSRVHAYLDQSHYVTAIMMTKHLLESYVEYFQQLADNCHIAVNEFDVPPLHFRPPVYGTNGEEFASYILPGVVLAVLLSVISGTTSILFIADRKEKTLSRSRVAGITTFHVLSSHLITQGFVILMQIVLLGIVLQFCFDFPVVGSLWLSALFCLLVGLCGAVMGILMGIVCNDEVEAVVVEIFLLPFVLVFGGAIWPTESMTNTFQTIGSILPTTLPTLSLRTVIIRGLGLFHPLVWPGFAVLVAWIAVLFILSILAYKVFCK